MMNQSYPSVSSPQENQQGILQSTVLVMDLEVEHTPSQRTAEIKGITCNSFALAYLKKD